MFVSLTFLLDIWDIKMTGFEYYFYSSILCFACSLNYLRKDVISLFLVTSKINRGTN